MTKPPLVMLHGALGSATQMTPLSLFLQDHFILGSIDFSGHGKNASLQKELSFDLFLEDIQQWINQKEVEKINIFGYSMGGYAALLFASCFPEKVDRVFSLGTKLLWTEEESKNEAQFLYPEKMVEKTPQFAERLKDLHGISHWSGLVNNTRKLILDMANHAPLSEADFKSIHCPVLLGIGDKDTMAKVDDTVRVYGWLPQGELLVIPNTPHPFEKVDLESLAQQIIRFFKP